MPVLLPASGLNSPPAHAPASPAAVDKQRRFLRLQSLLGRRAQRVLSGTADVAPAALPGDASFYSMLLQLLESCKWVG